MMAAVGCGSLPTRRRSVSRSASIEEGPQAGATKLMPMIVHSLPGWEIAGQVSPRAASPYAADKRRHPLCTAKPALRLAIAIPPEQWVGVILCTTQQLTAPSIICNIYKKAGTSCISPSSSMSCKPNTEFALICHKLPYIAILLSTPCSLLECLLNMRIISLWAPSKCAAAST